MKLRIENLKLRIENLKLRIENYKRRSKNRTPFNVAGFYAGSAN